MSIAKLGTEIQINTTDGTGLTSRPQMVALDNGNYVVTWQDGNIRAQLFAPDGSRIGNEIRVNTSNGGQLPQIVVLEGGRFVIAWEGGPEGAAFNDQSFSSIRAQVFSAAGVKVGGELLVNSATIAQQFKPQLAALSNGGFVVTWEDGGVGTGSEGVGGATGDTSESAVKGQVFNANGARVGNELRLNTTTARDQLLPDVIGLADGGFVAVWEDYSAFDTDDAMDIRAQVYNNNGAKVGAEFIVNTDRLFAQRAPLAVALDNGGFVVVWTGRDGSLTGVRAQVFAADGSKLGAEIAVNTIIADPQENPHVAALADGGFVISWDDAGVGHIRAQRFAADGTPVGAEILVDSAIPGGQSKLTGLVGGGFVVSWTGSRIGAQVFDAEGQKVDAEIRVDSTALSNHGNPPTLAALAGGGFAVAWWNNATFDSYTQAFEIGARGGAGADSLAGSGLSERLSGLGGNDSLAGAGGNDTLDGGTGADTLAGGAGDDVYLLNAALDAVVELADGGIDLVRSSTSRTLGDNVEQLVLTGTGATRGTGNALDNLVVGNAASNALGGLDGRDTLDGGAGDDTLTGGAGRDVLTGGDGSDVFRFSRRTDSAANGNRDRIADFGTGDRLDLAAIDADTTQAGNQAFTLSSGGTFSGSFANPGELYFDTTAGILYGNTDADAAAEFSIAIAFAGNKTSLVEADLLL